MTTRTTHASDWRTWLPGRAQWLAGHRTRAVAQCVLVGLVVLALVGLFPAAMRGCVSGRPSSWLPAIALLLLPVCVFVVFRIENALSATGTLRSPLVRSLSRLVRNDVAMAGAWVVLALGFVALLAPLLAPFDPYAFGDMGATRFLPPGTSHALGTDQFGRDVASRMLYGARVSLAVGLVAVCIAASIGTAVGLLAGYKGSWVDSILMRGIDLLIAFPRLFLVLLIVSLTQPSIWVVITVLGLTSWMSTARLVRAEVLRVRESEFVHAARALGFPLWRVLLRHVLPNTLAPIIVSATLMIGNVILAESVLSFLGLGVQIPTPSWGAMIDEGRKVFPGVWWLSTFPGVAITLTVVAFNLLGDGLRDAFDPQVQDESA